MNWNSGGDWDISSQRAQVRQLSGTAALGARDLGKMRADATAARQGIEDGRKQQTFGGAIDTMRSGMDFGPMGGRTSSGGLGFMNPNDSLNLVKTKAIAGFGSSVGPSIFAQKQGGGGGGGGGGGILEKPEDKHKREMQMQGFKDQNQYNLEQEKSRGLLQLQAQQDRAASSAAHWQDKYTSGREAAAATRAEREAAREREFLAGESQAEREHAAAQAQAAGGSSGDPVLDGANAIIGRYSK